jgi:outer membrane receptor protein involved in Fe transport
LQAEEAESFTYGFVYSPAWAEGLSMTFDVFDIEIDNAVSTVGAQNILDACAGDGVTLCSFVQRSSGGGVLDLFNGLVNLGGQTTSGFDTNIQYGLETEFGEFNFLWDATYIDERSVIVVDPVAGTSVTVNQAGSAFDRDVVPRVRSNISASWLLEDFSASYLIRFINHTIEDCGINDALEQELCSEPSAEVGGQSFNRLGDMAYHDVSGSYQINDQVKVTIGVNNLWNTDPQVSYSTFANSFDPSMYEIPGRFAYTRLSMAF